MKFPEKVWIEVNIQMKQQIIDFFRNRFSKLKFTYQCLNLTGQMDEDTGIEEIKEGTIENMEKSKKLSNFINYKIYKHINVIFI